MTDRGQRIARTRARSGGPVLETAVELLAGRARFRALAEADRGGDRRDGRGEGPIMQRLAVDPDAPDYAAIEGVVRAISRDGAGALTDTNL